MLNVLETQAAVQDLCLNQIWSLNQELSDQKLVNKMIYLTDVWS